MKIASQINELIKHNDSTTGLVSYELGQSHSNLLNKLTRDNLRINELEDISKALGYTQMEIVLRGSKEDAVILPCKVEYKKHNMYMMIDNSKTLLEDIQENGFRESTFKDLIFEVMMPHFERIFGDTLDAYVPKQMEEYFREALHKALVEKDITPIHLDFNTETPED